MSEVSFYVFEKKGEIACIDKKMEVKGVAKTLTEEGGSYLRHRSLVAYIKNTVPLIRKLLTVKYIVMFFFLNCYLAVPRSTLGHCRGGRLTNPMLITAFGYWFQPEGHWQPHNEA